MTNNELNWLKDTVHFIDQYRGSEDVREEVNQTYKYHNNSVFFYVSNLVRFSPHYSEYYNKTFAKSLSYVSDKRTRATIRDLPDKIGAFLDKCVRDSQEYNRLINTSLGQISNPSYYSQQELEQLYAMDQSPQHQKADLFDKFLAGIDRGIIQQPVLRQVSEEEKEEQKQPVVQTPRVRLQKPQIPSAVQDVVSKGGIGVKRLETRALQGLGNMVRSGGGSLLRGGGSAAARAGGAAVQVGLRGLIALGASTGGVGWVIAGAVLIVIGLLILIPIFMNLQESSSLLTGQQLASTGSYGGDISQCKFTRGGDSTKELTYKSQLLLSYVQEASNLTGIPSVVLAAFIRVETPSTVTKNDEQIRSLSSVSACPRSETGALGVMQLQPKGTKGHDEDAIANGAKFAGLNYNSLTETDYCDVKKNIIMGAGFILKKLSYRGFGDGTKWNPEWNTNKTAIDSLVHGYYGCLLYPSCSAGPYNYGNDVWTSMQGCQSSLATIPSIGTDILLNIVSNAARITTLLIKGSDNGLYHIKRDEPNVYYWCTYLIADSYLQAGVKGLDRGKHGAVLNMKSFFTNTPGYRLLPPDANIQQLGLGGVIIFEGSGNQHASLIKSFELDGTGNGVIKTFDSNNIVTEDTVFVRGNKAISAQTTSRIYSITGFGQLVDTR